MPAIECCDATSTARAAQPPRDLRVKFNAPAAWRRSVLAALLVLVLACPGRRSWPPFRPGLCRDRAIAFGALATTIPITRPGYYVRFDGFQPDLDRHQEALVKEFGLGGLPMRFTNPAQSGRTLSVEFAGGERCEVVWAKPDQNHLVGEAHVEHEKVHVLMHLAADRLGDLEQAMAARGLPVALHDFDEETAASIVEVASIHLGGIALEEIHGTGHVPKAVGVLQDARRKAGAGRN
jgi:hypothetical protein